MGRRKVYVTPDEFWSRVDRSGGPDACWEWKAGKINHGYGEFMTGGKQTLAHRHAYTLSKGSIPSGMFICHVCDNPPCCNPAHLFTGSNSENLKDAAQKGRMSRGEKHPNAKLTEDQVREIRARYEFRKTPAWRLCREYGIQDWTLLLIVKRRTWKHI